LPRRQRHRGVENRRRRWYRRSRGGDSRRRWWRRCGRSWDDRSGLRLWNRRCRGVRWRRLQSLAGRRRYGGVENRRRRLGRRTRSVHRRRRLPGWGGRRRWGGGRCRSLHGRRTDGRVHHGPGRRRWTCSLCQSRPLEPQRRQAQRGLGHQQPSPRSAPHPRSIPRTGPVRMLRTGWGCDWGHASRIWAFRRSST
jgi:hypothetical protein